LNRLLDAPEACFWNLLDMRASVERPFAWYSIFVVSDVARSKHLLEQVKSLEEMLEWQRTQSTQATRDAAAQKKVLVKEVKKLRAALRQVSEDRDTYQRQANMLMARGKK